MDLAEELDQYAHISELVLDGNKFEELPTCLPSTLTKLSLAHNRLRRLPDMRRFSNLQFLNLRHNALVSTAGLSFNNCLLTVDFSVRVCVCMCMSVSIRLVVTGLRCATRPSHRHVLQHNKIRRFEGLEPLKHLANVYASDNLISKVSSVRCLSLNTALQELVLAGNPLTGMPRYRTVMHAIVPQAQLLDGMPQSATNSRKQWATTMSLSASAQSAQNGSPSMDGDGSAPDHGHGEDAGAGAGAGVGAGASADAPSLVAGDGDDGMAENADADADATALTVDTSVYEKQWAGGRSISPERRRCAGVAFLVLLSRVLPPCSRRFFLASSTPQTTGGP